MLTAFTEPRHRRLTYTLLAIGVVGWVSAFIVGFDGNAVANTLARAASLALVAAMAHPWRRVREFKLLVYGSALAFIALALVHVAFDGLSSATGGVPLVSQLCQAMSAGAFLVLVFLVPIVFAVGLAGVVVTLIWGRTGAPGAALGG